MLIGYLGPEGTFSHEAAVASPGSSGFELVGLTTIRDVVMAVENGDVQRGLVPIENSIEGSINVTLDTLVLETSNTSIIGEVVHRISQCLIAPSQVRLEEVEVVVSHPQPIAQCARFIRESLPNAQVMPVSSTSEAVRLVAEHGPGWVALGPRLAAAYHGCEVLLEGVEDEAGNQTRFVWLASTAQIEPVGDTAGWTPAVSGIDGFGVTTLNPPSWKTAIVFWGTGSGSPGWLVDCLTELSSRGVNMTRIESRPLKLGLGEYMFFIDCEGRADGPELSAALAALKEHTKVLRVLGSFPAA
jgi:prephenate dehydratase